MAALRDFERARRVAWTGAAVAGAIGLLFTAVALFGGRWMGLFTTDPAIREVGEETGIDRRSGSPADSSDSITS